MLMLSMSRICTYDAVAGNHFDNRVNKAQYRRSFYQKHFTYSSIPSNLLFCRVTYDVRRSITPTEEADEVQTFIDYHSAFEKNFLHSSVQYHIIV